MRVARAAFVRLVAVAEADGRVSGEEDALLERYRQMLRLPKRFVRRVRLGRGQEEPVDAAEASPTERRHILKMMVRVAVHDGVIDPTERELLEEVAETLGISQVEFADIVVAVEHEAGTRHGLRRGQLATLCIAAGLVAILLFIFFQVQGNRARQDSQAQSLADLRLGLDARAQVFALDGSAGGARRVESREAALEERIEELERAVRGKASAPGEEASDPVTPDRGSEASTPDTAELGEVRAELAALRSELTELRRSSEAFQRIAADWNDAIVLLWVMYDLVSAGDTRRRGASGTGFFLSPSGYLATAKHVVEPWKYRPEDVRLIRSGYALDPDSIRIAAWPAGKRLRRRDGGYDWGQAYGTWSHDLRLIAVGPDRFEVMTRSDSGRSVRASFHVYDTSDVALLKAEVTAPVVAVPLQPDLDRIEKVDPVMLLGFPHTFSLIENQVVETAPSLGEVRKVENRIFTTAPTIGGNSGGPLFDREGRVLGIASTSHGASTLGGIVPIQYVLQLLPPGEQLLASASHYEHGGHRRAALDLLLLAEQCGASHLDVEAPRARLLRPGQTLIEEARRLTKRKRHQEARSCLERVVFELGPYWGREAAALLDELR